MTRLTHLVRSRNPAASGDATRDDTVAGHHGDRTDAPPAAGRQSGTDADAGPGQQTPGDETPEQDLTKARRGDRRAGALSRRLVPSVGAALLVLGGCAFFYGAHQLRTTPSAENRALTDAGATSRVAGDVGNALARVFSYAPDGLEATERAARSVLAGRAQRQYTELMDRIRRDVAEQRVTLSTQAVRTGVIELDGDSARLLVFLDQMSHRGKAGTTAAAAQLTVTARWEEDQWRIVDIRTH
ncbi:hypothetical protein [Streptomyces sp. NPDC004783]|uniref:hypothetical protein n=1 Tax=Streptomyces sp. NPDC004783 TaxID=3154459 RepID=UPI0033A289F8